MSIELLVTLVGIGASAIGSLVGFFLARKRHEFEIKFGFTAQDQKNKYEAHLALWGVIRNWSDRVDAYVGKNSKNRKAWTEEFMSFWYSRQGILIDRRARTPVFAVVDYITYTVERDGGKFDEKLFTQLKRTAQEAIASTIGEEKYNGKVFKSDWLRQ